MQPFCTFCDAGYVVFEKGGQANDDSNLLCSCFPEGPRRRSGLARMSPIFLLSGSGESELLCS